MKFKTILIILIIAGLIGGGIYLLLNVEKTPEVDNTKLTDENSFLLYLGAYDELFTQQITDFAIQVNGGKTYFLKSNLDGFESLRLPKNITFSIFNINSSYFYTNKLLLNYDESLMGGGFKVNYPLTTIGNLNVNRDKDLDKVVLFNVNSTNSFRFIKVCLRWSSNIIYSKILEFEETPTPSRLVNKVDKCFDTKLSLKDGESFNFTLDTFYNLIEKDVDYVNVYFIDGDNDYLTQQPTWGEETDIGAKDIIIKLK